MVMTLQFLDIGMGDATLMELPMASGARGPMCIIDYGEYWTPKRVAQRDSLIFTVNTIAENSKARFGTKTPPVLDYLFLTHSDQDHWSRVANLILGKDSDDVGGLNDMWKAHGYPPGTTMRIGHLAFGGEWAEYQRKNLASTQIIDKAMLNAPDDLDDDDDDLPMDEDQPIEARWPGLGGSLVDIYLLSSNYPTKSGGAPNPKSLVLMLKHADGRFIIPGDAEDVVEKKIVSRFTKLPLLCDGLRLGHHGSRKGTSVEWLAATKPKAIFVSSDARWGHPYNDAIKRVIDAKCLGQGQLKYYSSYIDKAPAALSNYVSTQTKDNICTTLWYVVTDAAGQTLKDWDKAAKHEPYGTYMGVQYAMFLPLTGAEPIASTQSWPDPNQNAAIEA